MFLRPIGGDGKVDAVGIGLHQCHAAFAQRCEDLREYLAPAPGHFSGGVAIGEEGHRAGAHVAIGGVYQDFHGRRCCVVMIGLHGARRSSLRCGLVRQAQVGQPTQDAEQDAQAVTGRADLEGAHERGVQRGNIGLNHVFGHAFREKMYRAALVQCLPYRLIGALAGERSAIV